MIWLIAIGYVCAMALSIGGLALRHDPRVLERLRHDGRRRESRGRGILDVLGGSVPDGGARNKVRRLLGELGREQDCDRILGTKIVCGAAGAAVGGTLAGSGITAGVIIATLLAVAGFAVPNFILGRRTVAWRARFSAAVPDLLDAVAVCVTAGLSPRLALERSADVVRGPLARELERARRQVALGAQWRSALRGMAKTTRLPELRRLSVTLERSERLGSSVANQLRRLARDVRGERRLQEEERARRAPVAMLFPLVLCILPAFVLAAVVPALLVAARDIG